ncbi:sugar phosphatase [Rosenbergiella australiborealis]|uniref:Sugar phosphatase n=1 Tax=Rosenbergiella australiborealis TaxID=1544696 RepID=A0ABS5T320_9GAMM|nr:sugar phosphatase [Rosenbergiella australiborealis]MBT0726744.1 sugar phosphatase [Rosenbergiella australiborealis]
MYRGFLFDLDGTLVDSLAVVESAWSQWGQQQGIAAEEILAFIHGKQAITSLRHFLPHADETTLREEFLWLEHLESTTIEGIIALPGARELLSFLNEQQIPWAIVTSSSLPVATARYQVLNLPLPEVFITAEQVAQGKPYPDPYLLGAKQLNLAPETCVVVEDALAGIQSGLAAGCSVVAVNTQHGSEHLSPTYRLSALTELTISIEPNGFTLN